MSVQAFVAPIYISCTLQKYQEKLQKLQGDSHKRMVELEDNLAKVDGHKKELQKYIRELEQDNDDLERAKR